MSEGTGGPQTYGYSFLLSLVVGPSLWLRRREPLTTAPVPYVDSLATASLTSCLHPSSGGTLSQVTQFWPHCSSEMFGETLFRHLWLVSYPVVPSPHTRHSSSGPVGLGLIRRRTDQSVEARQKVTTGAPTPSLRRVPKTSSLDTYGPKVRVGQTRTHRGRLQEDSSS